MEHATIKQLKQLFSKIKVSTEHFYRNSPCWEWIAAKNEHGYGVVNFRGKCRAAYAVIFDLFGDLKWEPGLERDHLCRNRACCNPAHLEPVTRAVNIQRGAAAEKWTHCAQGHELTPENTYVRGRRKKRSCRICELARIAANRKANPEHFLQKEAEYRDRNREKMQERDRARYAAMSPEEKKAFCKKNNDRYRASLKAKKKQQSESS